MSDLWERLRTAKTRQEAVEPAPPIGAEEAPDGWSWVTALVAKKVQVIELEPGFWAALSPLIDASAWEGTLCFDTETTGLSGGAGTVAFLIGWSQIVSNKEDGPPSVEITQWFLRDHPGEHDMIEAIDAVLRSTKGLVSFNGASFDLPLLRSRWSLAGRDLPELPHRDDLHPSRRLWKRLLESCRLSQLEQSVLGIHRVDDVPGSLVPALWFDYLRQGAHWDFLSPLQGVFHHHAQDVYSLLCLDLLLAAIQQQPNHSRWEESFAKLKERPQMLRVAPGGLLHPVIGSKTRVDFWGLLRLREGEDQSLALEEAWEREGNEALGLAWADKLKRQGHPGARQIWTSLWVEDRSFTALEELLKWLEHREKSEAARAEALAHLELALNAAFLPRAWKDRLEKRQRRLVRRGQP